jgi:hypothetical protein
MWAASKSNYTTMAGAVVVVDKNNMEKQQHQGGLEQELSEWRLTVERKLDTLEQMQVHQATKIDYLESDAMLLHENHNKMQSDVSKILVEMKRKWWQAVSPITILMIVLLFMVVKIIYNIITVVS